MTASSTVYRPQIVEKKWYSYWEQEGFFHAERKEGGEPFTIVIPPPNITGELHMGHALNNTLQDILIRWKRMQGRVALWLPGTDHAGIATQVRVEQDLAQEGIKKGDLSREEFLKRVWEWKEEYGSRITNQLRRLGSSCDWERERFTLDEGCSKAVREVFVRLYEQGLIYQGNYLVNWCTCCGTTLSDIEVQYQEQDGKIYHIQYPLQDGSGSISVATTRPETMLGDSGVAVNPQDERYQGLLGKKALLPILNRSLPIFSDTYVDQTFGTGVVKVTPAHDPNDFEMGERHSLAVIKVIDEKGRMTQAAGPYQGLSVSQCRKELVKDLQAGGFLLQTEDYRHAVGHCYRCDSIIEPLTSKQWFVKMKPLAKPAIEVVERGQVRFIPHRFARIYRSWMEEIRDWCISRQLVWGHRIPVWYCQECSEVLVSREDPAECTACQGQLIQDPDVLDTWFSSALWPFSTLGWPEETADLDYFYPTQVLVTARDIIFFWVARMIFSGLEFMKEPPFPEVLIHGLILDEEGRKMSKSLDNGIDPLEVIGEFGADSLRFTLITGNTPGNDLRFRQERLESSRNFANKIWNASRFVFLHVEKEHPDGELGDLSLADRWILSRLQGLKKRLGNHLESYLFGEAAQDLYDFIWGEFCDWYLELSKERLYSGSLEEKTTTRRVMVKTLEEILLLLHPIMPFITEEIWQKIPGRGPTIMQAPWPSIEEDLVDEKAQESMEALMDIIRHIRRVRNEMKINPGKKISCHLLPATQEDFTLLKWNRDYIRELGGVEDLQIVQQIEMDTKKVISIISGSTQIFLPLVGMVDLQEEKNRLQKELETVISEVHRAQKKLENKQFVSRAPERLVEEEREKLKKYLQQEQQLQGRLQALE